MNGRLYGSSKKAISLLLVLTLVLTGMNLNLIEVKAQTETNYIMNPGFETDIWTGTDWQYTCDWNNVSLDQFQYSTDQWLTGGTDQYGLKYWVKNTSNTAQDITVSQTVSSLPAGVYTLTGKVMGENSNVIASVGSVTGAAVTTTSYNTWHTFQVENVVIVEGATNIPISIKINGSPNAYGYVDDVSITLVKKSEPYLMSIPNGDFESASTN